MSSNTIKFIVFLLCLLGLTVPSNVQGAPSKTGISPYPGAPLCPTHDDKTYHGLWDSIRGCHYDHTHNDDPALANTLFGPAGALWGQSLSYPWMTPNENSGSGHSGYKYYINLDPSPRFAQEGYDYLNPDPNFVTAFRIQYHDVGGNAHMVKRFHSYYLEAQIQSKNLTSVGKVSFGGWADFGCMHLPYKTEPLYLPGIDPTAVDGSNACATTQPFGSDPYRAASTLEDITRTQEAMANGRNPDNKWIWTSHDRYGYNSMGYFFFRTLDSWTGMDRNDPYAEHFICPDFQCKFNNSEHHVFNVFIMIPSSLDTDGDGIVNYVGYTDIKGNIVQGCVAPGTNCIPLRIVNAPVGIAIWSRNLSGPRPEGDPIRDHDIYFNGQPSGWIQFNTHTSQSPAPTDTPPTSGPFVSTEVNPASLNIGGTALVSVNLNNVPAEGYKSAEFTCSYDAGLIEKSNIVATELFGADPVVAIHDPQNGSFIVAVAGTDSNRATTSGPAFTFSAKGLQAGQSPIQCTARVSKGDNVPIDLPATAAGLTILGTDSSPTSSAPPTATPGGHEHPTATSMPVESTTPEPTLSPTSTPSPNGSLSGQVIASKPVTVSLLDAGNTVITSVVANPDGTFILTPLAGNYTLVATASGFLSHQGSVSLTAGNTTVLPAVSLLAGDVDGNNVIDQFDALTIGMSYTTAAPESADLNSDGVIDFLDLELLAENYRMTGPTNWE